MESNLLNVKNRWTKDSDTIFSDNRIASYIKLVLLLLVPILILNS